MDNQNDIMVSVCILAYNHEKFIRHALESVIMQETSFPFEIIVGDDCSQDRTVEIAREVLKKFDGKSTVIAREKNIGMNANDYDMGLHAKGKYIADLEGDDFWIDKHKLQKQFEFLESHPECSMVAHRVAVVNEREHPIGMVKPDIKELNHYFGKADAMKYQAELCHPASMMFWNIYRMGKYQYLNNSSRNFGGHKIFIFLLAALGKIYISDEVMAAFRLVTRTCASNARSLVLQNELFWECGKLDLFLYMKKHLSDSYDFTDFISQEWVNLAMYLYRSKSLERKSILSKYFKKLSLKEKLKLPVFLVQKIYL